VILYTKTNVGTWYHYLSSAIEYPDKLLHYYFTADDALRIRSMLIKLALHEPVHRRCADPGLIEVRFDIVGSSAAEGVSIRWYIERDAE